MRDKRPKPSESSYYDIEKVAANNECTGLIPSAVMNEDESEAYQSLYGIPAQKPNTVAGGK